MTTTLLAASGSPPEEPTEDLANRVAHLGAVLRRQGAAAETLRPAMGVEQRGRRRRFRRTVLGSIALAGALVGTGATFVATRSDPNPIVGLIADPLPERFDTIDEPTAYNSEWEEELLLVVDGVDVVARRAPTSPMDAQGGRVLNTYGVRVMIFDPPSNPGAVLPTTATWKTGTGRFEVTIRTERSRTDEMTRSLVRSSSTGRFASAPDVLVLARWKGSTAPFMIWLGERAGGGFPSFAFSGPAAFRTRIVDVQFGGAGMAFQDGFLWQPSAAGPTVRALRLREATQLAKHFDAELAAAIPPEKWIAVCRGISFADVGNNTGCLRVGSTVACDREAFSRIIDGRWYVVGDFENLTSVLNERNLDRGKGYRTRTINAAVRRMPDDATSVVDDSRVIHRPRW